jgi:hypothetical protein
MLQRQPLFALPATRGCMTHDDHLHWMEVPVIAAKFIYLCMRTIHIRLLFPAYYLLGAFCEKSSLNQRNLCWQDFNVKSCLRQLLFEYAEVFCWAALPWQRWSSSSKWFMSFPSTLLSMSWRFNSDSEEFIENKTWFGSLSASSVKAHQSSLRFQGNCEFEASHGNHLVLHYVGVTQLGVFNLKQM